MAAVAIIGALSAHLSAHRRDEYLQAARIGIGAGRLAVQLDLTPGIAVAEAIVADLDRDRDGTVSDDEQKAYARRVLEAIHVALDDRAVALEPVGVTFPDVDALRRGEGTIRLEAAARIPNESAGPHELLFQNTFQPAISVYLANALVPDTAGIEISAQQRDPTQRVLAISYTRRADRRPSSPPWIAAAFIIAAIGTVTVRRIARQ